MGSKPKAADPFWVDMISFLLKLVDDHLELSLRAVFDSVFMGEGWHEAVEIASANEARIQLIYPFHSNSEHG